MGMPVLDVMRDEQLQQNTAVIGDYLSSRLRELVGRHSISGTVYGIGLYLGVELVRAPVSLEPAMAELSIICARL